MAEASRAPRGRDDNYLVVRLREEVDAALRCDDAKAAAIHVELANRYLMRLNGSARENGPA